MEVLFRKVNILVIVADIEMMGTGWVLKLLMCDSRRDFGVHLEELVLILVESESESPSAVSDSLQPHGLYSPWNSPGQNTGVGSLSLLQGIFSTQGSNPGISCITGDCLPAEPNGNPRILEL